MSAMSARVEVIARSAWTARLHPRWWRERWSVVALLRTAPAAQLTGYCMLLAAGVALPPALGYVEGRLIAAVSAPSPPGGVPWVLTVVFAALFVAIVVRAPAAAAAGRLVARQLDAGLRARVTNVTTASAVLDVMEQPEFKDAVRRIAGGTGAVVVAVADNSTALTGAMVGAVIVASFSPLLAIALVLVLFGTRRYISMRSESLGQSINAGTSDLRRGRYWASVAASSASSKEARLFGLSEWAVATSQHLVRRGMSLRWAPRTRFLGQFAAVTVGTLSLTFTVLALVLTVSLGQGSIGAGTLVFLLASASIVGNAIGSMPVRAAELSARVEALRGLCGLESTLCSPATSPVRLSAPRQAIVFDGVCFAYPGSVVRALDGVSLRIPAGRSVAVVGANGAGKTTLVKLLGGLHAPTAGRILIDGVDLASCDAQAWRMNIAAAFQDFVRYPLTARDNVGLGAATGTGDPGHADGIAEAAEQAGLSVVIERLASGWDTPLVKDRRGGTDLSGGEWQRVALARAFVGIARGRSVLILDEPTANLDIRAEASFYASFLDLTRGLTTVLISHRFASVRQADLIHVLDGGRVVESGSHDELLARGGRYAAMYAVQAASFADRPAPAEAVAG